MSLYIDTALENGGSVEDVTGGPIPLYLDDINSFSFHQQWNHSGTADLVATTTVEASNDPRVQEDINAGVEGTASETANWEDVSTLFSTTLESPTSGAGQSIINGSFGGFKWVRLKCDASSGSGDGGYRVWLNFNLK